MRSCRLSFPQGTSSGHRTHLRGLAVLVLLASASLARADQYYLAPDGDDGNPGTIDQPWKTVAKASSTIVAGDEVILRGGIYLEDAYWLSAAGQSERRTVFRAMDGERPVLTRADGHAPVVNVGDTNFRVEGLWMGGQWTHDEGVDTAVFLGGAVMGRGVEFVNNTVFGYQNGISAGSSENLLVQGNRIIHCGNGTHQHGIYVSGGYSPNLLSQHIIVDNNVFVGGQGYAIHGWHHNHSDIITRNFVSSYWYGLVIDGHDHLVANNVIWARPDALYGQWGGGFVCLAAEESVFVNNILGETEVVINSTVTTNLVSHNAVVQGAWVQAACENMYDWREGTASMYPEWEAVLDQAVTNIDTLFSQDLQTILANPDLESWFDALSAVPIAAPGFDVGLQPAGEDVVVGRGINIGDFWTAFDRMGLQHYDKYGNAIPAIPGDADHDGYVDAADAAILAAHWGDSGDWQTGDFNNDDVVDAADAAILAANWSPRPAESTSVPEPSTFILLFSLLGLFGGRTAQARRRRQTESSLDAFSCRRPLSQQRKAPAGARLWALLRPSGPRLLRLVFCGTVAAMPLVFEAKAGVVTWQPDADGNWEDATNWSSSPSLPGASDDVVIGSPGSTVRTVALNTQQTIAGLSGCHNLVFHSGGSLDIGPNGGSLSGVITGRGSSPRGRWHPFVPPLRPSRRRGPHTDPRSEGEGTYWAYRGDCSGASVTA